MTAKIYEGTRGFVIDVPIRGIESLSGIQHAHLHVMVPGCTEPQVWPVTLEAELGVLRHVVPDDAPLVAGRYLIQPYLEIGDFKGRWGTVMLFVDKRFR